MSEPVEAEIVEEHALAVTERHTPVAAGALFGTSDPAEIMASATKVASLLAEAVRSRKLAKSFGGDREHVQVEGWQLLGAMLGIYAETEWTRQVTVEGVWREPVWRMERKRMPSKFKDGEFYEKDVKVVTEPGVGGWEARVVVRRADGSVVTSAEAECRWSEPNWSDRDSYAVRSMAQTRASGKAYRTALGFVMTLAGYAGTPAEEMDGIHSAAGEPDDDGTGPRCPACGAKVIDQRDTATGRQPLFKCSNRACKGGKDGKYSWASWDPDQFTDLLTADLDSPAAGADQELDRVEEAYRAVQRETGQIRDLAETFVFEAANQLGFTWPDPALPAEDQTRLIDRAIYIGTGTPEGQPDTFAAFAAFPLAGLQEAEIRLKKDRIVALAKAAQEAGLTGFPQFEEHGTKAYWNERTKAVWEWAKAQGDAK